MMQSERRKSIFLHLSRSMKKHSARLLCKKQQTNHEESGKGNSGEKPRAMSETPTLCFAKPTKKETNLSMKLFAIRFFMQSFMYESMLRRKMCSVISQQPVKWKLSLMKSFSDASEKRKRRCGKTFCFRWTKKIEINYFPPRRCFFKFQPKQQCN